MPSPPAFETAPANRPSLTPAIGAWTSGRSIPSVRVSQVSITFFSSGPLTRVVLIVPDRSSGPVERLADPGFGERLRRAEALCPEADPVLLEQPPHLPQSAAGWAPWRERVDAVLPGLLGNGDLVHRAAVAAGVGGELGETFVHRRKVARVRRQRGSPSRRHEPHTHEPVELAA